MTEESKVSFLFIHGAGGTKNKWRFIHKKMQDNVCQFVDLPGRSDQHKVSASNIESYADLLNEEIKEETIVVGHSMGGLVGIELAGKNSNIRGLILVASHYRLPVHPKILDKLAGGEFPEGLFHASYRENVEKRLLVVEKSEIGLVPLKRTYMDFFACNAYKSGEKTFSELTIPILCIYGKEDRLLPERALKEVKMANPLATVTTIEASGHYVMLEQPDEFADRLLQFKHKVTHPEQAI